MINHLKQRYTQYIFLFSQLVKRDFTSKYKRTALGLVWSILDPILRTLVMYLVFTQFFGNDTPHFIVYIFVGQLVFSFFSNGTTAGMQSLMGNAGLISKVRVPKYLFLLSRNVATVLEFATSLLVLFIFIAIEGIAFSPRWLLLVYPIITLLLTNIGIGLTLSALFVFFKDIGYLYSIMLQLLMFMSAIFWPVSNLSIEMQRLLMINPVFSHIQYFRLVLLYGQTPTAMVHMVLLFYPIVCIGFGMFMYKKFSHRFVYYM